MRSRFPGVGIEPELPELPDELIDQLLAGARTPAEIGGPDGLLSRLTKRLIERAMDAELADHLGYERGRVPPGGAGNSRNGITGKTVDTEQGSVRIEQPRDRQSSFEPQIVGKRQRRFTGFDERIVAMYARGMSVRDIQAHLAEIYGVEVGHDLISRVTDAVLDDVREWQTRPLEDIYPILFLDALVVKVRDGGAVRNRACYVAIGVNLDGERDVLGLWFQADDLFRVVYTTNTIEALHRQIRKIIKTQGHFPTEEAARKLIYLAITNAQKNWKHTDNWSSALLQFKIHFGDRLP